MTDIGFDVEVQFKDFKAAKRFNIENSLMKNQFIRITVKLK